MVSTLDLRLTNAFSSEMVLDLCGGDKWLGPIQPDFEFLRE
jgi:hypothetical protein